MKGQTGGSLGGRIIEGERRRKRKAKARKRQDERWAAQAGPTLITIGEHQIYVKSQAKADIAAARAFLLGQIAAGAPPGDVTPADA